MDINLNKIDYYVVSPKNLSESFVNYSDSYQTWELEVPYWKMGPIAGAVKESCLGYSKPTVMILKDLAYGIQLHIIWKPRNINEEDDYCEMSKQEYHLFHNKERIQIWKEEDKDVKYKGINHYQMQIFINKLIEQYLKKASKQCWQQGVDTNSRYLQSWLSGGVEQYSPASYSEYSSALSENNS